jgi:hypothetical protein
MVSEKIFQFQPIKNEIAFLPCLVSINIFPFISKMSGFLKVAYEFIKHFFHKKSQQFTF